MKLDSKSYWIGVIVSVLCSFFATFPWLYGYHFDRHDVSALDVYRGKTTLEITYRDSVAVDSTVVYKVK